MAFDVRRAIRRVTRRTGFRRQVAPTFVEVMRQQRIDVVLDVGANDGDYGREIRDEGYAGRIVSFEPNPAVFARLQRAVADDPLWEAHQFGLGDVAGNLELSIFELDVFSSFKSTTDFGSASVRAENRKTATVPVMRLDAFLAERPDLAGRTYLKVDTQGFEMEVLRGAGELSAMSAVQLELALIATYEGEEDWHDVLAWMRARGFEVATALCNSRWEAQAREFDFVFVQRPPGQLSIAA